MSFALNVSTSIDHTPLVFFGGTTEVARVDRDGTAWIDGHEATDAQLGAAIRGWAAAMARHADSERDRLACNRH